MLELFFDGSCGPENPGGTAKYGFVIKDNEIVVSTGTGVIGSGPKMTNNIAEYTGLIRGLERLRDQFDVSDGVDIFGDSALVVNMVNKVWGKKNPHSDAPHLFPLLQKCWMLLENVPHELSWIPREQNIEADFMSKI